MDRPAQGLPPANETEPNINNIDDPALDGQPGISPAAYMSRNGSLNQNANVSQDELETISEEQDGGTSSDILVDGVYKPEPVPDVLKEILPIYSFPRAPVWACLSCGRYNTVADSHFVTLHADDNKIDSFKKSSFQDRGTKIGHRRVDRSGNVSYKKKPTTELMSAIQLGIGQSVGGLSAKPERDVLMQDFGVTEVVFFPGGGSSLTPAHRYTDFRFKTYAPVAFRYFRDLFGIQPDDFMLSLCDDPLKELSNPGASGSIFYLTQDDEFIIKTVQHKETDFLQKLLPGYFLNISQNKRTLLPKFYGLFCYQCGGKNIRFTVMNNLLPSTVELHEKYDMKGSTHKRKASKQERAKVSPTLKDLDFMENHPEGLLMEKDTYEALIKTLQRDCRVLESFKIMDYSLLMGIYNLDQADKEKQVKENTRKNSVLSESPTTTDSMALFGRGKSFKTRIGHYSTPLESIQGAAELVEPDMEDEDVPPGGIPAKNSKGERLLLYLGIIDILQSFRLRKRLEHTVKSMVVDGDTISVHRPSYYAHRFLQFHASRVFRKAPTGLKPSPNKKKSISKQGRSSQDLQASSWRGTKGGKPDLLPDHSSELSSNTNNLTYWPPTSGHEFNLNRNLGHLNISEPYNLSMYGSEEPLPRAADSMASLGGIGLSPRFKERRSHSPSPSYSGSTPTHTEGTPSLTNSSPSCSSDIFDTCYNVGGGSVFETSGIISPANSASPSPNLRYNGPLKPWTLSDRLRSGPHRSQDMSRDSLAVLESASGVTVTIVPGSPPTRGCSHPTPTTDKVPTTVSDSNPTASDSNPTVLEPLAAAISETTYL